MNKCLRVFENILSYTALICFISLIVVVSLQIVSRLLLPWIFAWTEELSRFLFITAVCSISPVALRYNEFVFVDFLTSKIHKKEYLELLQNIILVFFLALITSGSFLFMKLGFVNTSPVLKIPMWIPYIMPSIAFVFLLLFSIEKIIIQLFSIMVIKK